MSTEPITDLEAAEAAANMLNEENARLRDELGKFKARELITPEEQRRRWGQAILDAVDRA